MNYIKIVLLLGLIQLNGVFCTQASYPNLLGIKALGRKLWIFVGKPDNKQDIRGCSIFGSDLEALLLLDSNDTVDVYFGKDDPTPDRISHSVAGTGNQATQWVYATVKPNLHGNGVTDIGANALPANTKVNNIAITNDMLDFCDIEIALRDNSGRRNLVL